MASTGSVIPAAVGEPSDVVRQLDEVDAELRGRPDQALRAEVLAARSRSRAHLLADDRSDAAPMAAEALELARSAGDETTVASCLLAYHDAIWEPGTENERRATRRRARRGPAAVSPIRPWKRRVCCCGWSPRSRPATLRYLATHAQFDAVAEASRSPRLRFLAASRRGMVAALRADLPAALVEIDAARALGERIGEPDAVGMWCDQRWQLARHAGDHDTIAELLATLRDMGDPHWMIYEAIVAADLRRRRPRQATGAGNRRARSTLAAMGGPAVGRLQRPTLAILEHDVARIADLVDRLEPDAGHWAVLGGGVLVARPA